MSLDKLNKMIVSANKAIQDNEEFLLSTLIAKLEKIASIYPQDQTVITLKNVLSNTAEKKLLIKRAELRDLYNKLYTLNTKATEYLKDEIGQEEKLTSKVANTKEVLIDQSKYADPFLTNTFQTYLDKTATVQNFSKDIQTKVFKLVSTILPKSKISLAACNKYAFIVNAEFETPKGPTSILVPVEINENSLIEPSNFIGNNGLQDLKEVNSYLLNNTGDKLKVNANKVIELIKKVSEDNLSQVDIALAKWKLNKQANNKSFFAFLRSPLYYNLYNLISLICRYKHYTFVV